jgi:hypothetical protein
MRKKTKPFGVLFMTKRKFAITANLLLLFIILHNVMYIAFKVDEPIFFTAFFMTLVYFVASASYSLYYDMFEK